MSRVLRLPDPATELGAAIELALAACDEADDLAMRSFRGAMHIEAKADASFVTAADRAIEEVLRSRIGARFPDHGLVGEEYGELPSRSGRRWIIDPIDGTHNYMRGIPIFATLLAFELEGHLSMAVVSAPALRRRWFSWQDGGAWAVDLTPEGWREESVSALSVSPISKLAEVSLVYSSLPSISQSGLAPGFEAMLPDLWRDRGLGDFYGYMLVAEGAAEAMVEAELKIWDLAAPRTIVEHAGGRVTDLSGGSDMPRRGVLATNGRVHAVLLSALEGPSTGSP